MLKNKTKTHTHTHTHKYIPSLSQRLPHQIGPLFCSLDSGSLLNSFLMPGPKKETTEVSKYSLQPTPGPQDDQDIQHQPLKFAYFLHNSNNQILYAIMHATATIIIRVHGARRALNGVACRC
jgi:hypothetical protein